MKKKIRRVNPELTDGQMGSMLNRWFVEAEGAVKAYSWENNKAVVEWISKQLSESTWETSILYKNIKVIRRECVSQQIRRLVHYCISCELLIKLNLMRINSANELQSSWLT